MSTRNLGIRSSNASGTDDSLGSGSQFRHRLGGHRPERDALAVAPQIRQCDFLKSSQNMPARTQSPRKRVADAAFNKFSLSADYARLGAAQELVA